MRRNGLKPLYREFCLLFSREKSRFFCRRYFMIEIHNLTICHRYDLRKIIDGFTLTVKPTDKIAIIGEEGNGKSTLLKCIVDSQLIESYCEVQGTIRSKNERIRVFTPRT